MKTEKFSRDLQNALFRNEFELYAQSIIDLESKKSIGFEVLLRWEHPRAGMLMPDDFIKYAEDNNMIIEIDLWVLRKVLSVAMEQFAVLSGKRIHLNISVKTLKSPIFYEILDRNSFLLKEINLVLEFKQLADGSISKEIYERLSKYNIKLAIDQFGIGYSSFEKISKQHIQYVKIHKRLIENLGTNVDDLIVVKTLIEMCGKLEIDLIADGIEEVAELEFLMANHCKIAQGYLFDKPQNLMLLVNRIDEIDKKLIENNVITNSNKNTYSPKHIIIEELDLDGKIKYDSLILLEKLSIKEKHLQALPFKELIKEDQRDYFKRNFEALIDTKQPTVVSCTLLCGNGHEVMAVIAMQRERDTVRLYIEIANDIVEQKEALIGLSHSYVQAFQEAPSGMIILSDDYRVLKWNDSCVKMFGYTRNEAVGHNIMKLIVPAQGPLAMNMMLKDAILYGHTEVTLK